MHVHTAANAIPPIDDELAGLLEDLADVHDDAIDRLLALKPLTVDRTQTLIATLAGASDGTNVVTAIGLLIARLADPTSNPALRALPRDQQKNARLAGENAYRALADPDLHQTASETSAAIDGC